MYDGPGSPLSPVSVTVPGLGAPVWPERRWGAALRALRLKSRYEERVSHAQVVSAAFEGQSLVQRHRMVNSLLEEEFAAGLHALSISATAPSEQK